MNNIKWAHDLQFGTKRAYYEKLKAITKKVNKQGKNDVIQISVEVKWKRKQFI